VKLPVISGEQLIKILLKEGFIKKRQKGSHITLEKKTDEKTYKTVVPLHDSIAKGTLNSILKNVGLTKEDLLKLIVLVLGINL